MRRFVAAPFVSLVAFAAVVGACGASGSPAPRAGVGSMEGSPRALAQAAPMPTIPGLPPLGPMPVIPGLPIPGVPSPGGGGASSPLTARVVESKSTGDFHMSGGVGMAAGGALSISMAAIRHPDLGVPVNPLMAALSVSGSISGSASLVCSIGGISSGANAPVDIVFIDDTTGSMQGTVAGVSESVKRFSEEIGARGIDARFSMYTFGDAFATKPSGGFSVGRGDFPPPSFDSVARPYVGLSDLNTFESFLSEMKASKILGEGGGDEPENPLGAIEYSYRNVAWRQGSARVFIAITDTVAHQAGDKTSFITSPWTPPTGGQVIEDLDGDAVVHVVAREKEMAPFYAMKGLADGTGGAFLALPSDGRVDLAKLGMKDWVVNGFRGVCAGAAAGTIDLTIHATIVGKRVYEATLRFKIVVS